MYVSSRLNSFFFFSFFPYNVFDASQSPSVRSLQRFLIWSLREKRKTVVAVAEIGQRSRAFLRFAMHSAKAYHRTLVCVAFRQKTQIRDYKIFHHGWKKTRMEERVTSKIVSLHKNIKFNSKL